MADGSGSARPAAGTTDATNNAAASRRRVSVRQPPGQSPSNGTSQPVTTIPSVSSETSSFPRSLSRRQLSRTSLLEGVNARDGRRSSVDADDATEALRSEFLLSLRGELKSALREANEKQKQELKTLVNRRTLTTEKSPPWLPNLQEQMRTLVREELLRFLQEQKADLQRSNDVVVRKINRTTSVGSLETGPHEWSMRNVLINGVSRYRDHLHQVEEPTRKHAAIGDNHSEDSPMGLRSRGPIMSDDGFEDSPGRGRGQGLLVDPLEGDPSSDDGLPLARARSRGRLLTSEWAGRTDTEAVKIQEVANATAAVRGGDAGQKNRRQAIRLAQVKDATSEELPASNPKPSGFSGDPSDSTSTCFLEADQEIVEPLITKSTFDKETFFFDKPGGRLSRGQYQGKPQSEDAASMAPSVSCSAAMMLTVTSILRSNVWEGFVCLFLVANSVLIGIETDFRSSLGQEHTETDGDGVDVELFMPPIFLQTEILFCVFFTIEIASRIAVYRCAFFTASGCGWNWFDLFVAGVSLLDVMSRWIGPASDRSSHQNMSFLRVLRLIRMVRITRLVRVLRLVEELRTIVSSIAGSMKSLGWTLLLLFTMIYTVAICLTQLVVDHQMTKASKGVSVDTELLYWYGSVLRTILTLYECIASGVSWDSVIQPLITEISPMVGVVFCLYIAFSIFAMMNVVTGVFVEKAMQHAQEDKEEYLATHISEAFKRADRDDSGEVTWEEFEGRLEAEEMQEYFKAIDVDISEAKGLFKLIDADGSGSIDAVEFVSGCMRLRGPAKALELALLLHETNRMHEWLTDKTLRMEEQVGNTVSMLASLHEKMASVFRPRTMQRTIPEGIHLEGRSTSEESQTFVKTKG
eukprot:TRINITY_DN3601_c0_g3_i1.p1 TRINITY_DN3601_c0_g3~~TRINITY_DN3601_c0_g3_i1.p1  ORF type:complete len:900 (-),score=148.65 TRINITY_DN3601_c0_g3_i1:61-2649(-)